VSRDSTAVLDIPVAAGRTGPETAEATALGRLRRARAKHRALVWSLRLVVLAAFFGGWQLAATYWLDPFYYSKPSLIWDRLYGWFAHGTSKGSIWANLSVTIQEAVYGFVLGAVAGVVLGILFGRAKLLAEVLSPFIQALNAVPRIVLAALFIIWFGLGMESKIATALVLVFFPVFFNAFQGAREVDRTLVDNARILGASRTQILRAIVVPSATSWILASLHTAFGFALIGAIVGEYAGSSQGVGLLISTAQGTFDAAGIYAGMILSTVLALLAEVLLGGAERRLLRWRPPATGSAATAL
jgi:NitT/TauT family transport system permease protein